MTADDLRALMVELQRHVHLAAPGTDRTPGIVFVPPEVDAVAAAGLDPETYRRLQSASWWADLIEEVVETPEFCDPGEPPERVLAFARDVVVEYLRKRVELDEA